VDCSGCYFKKSATACMLPIGTDRQRKTLSPRMHYKWYFRRACERMPPDFIDPEIKRQEEY
jgi:hypothetical protein